MGAATAHAVAALGFRARPSAESRFGFRPSTDSWCGSRPLAHSGCGFWPSTDPGFGFRPSVNPGFGLRPSGAVFRPQTARLRTLVCPMDETRTQDRADSRNPHLVCQTAQSMTKNPRPVCRATHFAGGSPDGARPWRLPPARPRALSSPGTFLRHPPARLILPGAFLQHTPPAPHPPPRLTARASACPFSAGRPRRHDGRDCGNA